MQTIEKKMNQLHKDMYHYYKGASSRGKDIEDARKLQQFLYMLKKGANSNDYYDNLVVQQIIELLGQRFRRKTLFRTSGTGFEREIAQIEAIVAELVTGQVATNKIVKNLQTGSTHAANINIDDSAVSEFMQQLGTRYSKKLHLPQVGGGQIKMDVQGLKQVNLTILPNANQYLAEIFNILKHASFTLKSYNSASDSWVGTNLGIYDSVSLGKTQITTVLYNVLPVIAKSHWKYYLGLIANNQEHPQVILHVSHIKQIYELSGLGQIQNMEKGVKFLIYNDADGDPIVVKAISELVQQILNQKTVTENPFDNSINTLISRDLKKIGLSNKFERIKS